MAAELPVFVPPTAGQASVGVRLNRVNWFHGAVARARFTHEALAPSRFMAVPR